ncbi:MAG TPA: acetyl-CoA C-acyltransferase, partial [Symbiobacteriaceae bacterium]|nr:acetyl-CoA C-acyltransferase [Symbiobacteriaceae bacterium]
MRDVLVLGGARTPFGRFGGALKDIGAVGLGTAALEAALARSRVEAARIDNVVVGNVIQTGEDFAYLSRHIALAAGIPQTAPAMGVNRLCGSGMQAVLSAAHAIALGESELGAAGGTEAMSQAPYALRNRFGSGMGTPVLSDTLWETLTDTYCGTGMAITAENLAERYNISREEQDRFSVLSNQRVGEAIAAGHLSEEIVPVSIPGRKGETVQAAADEHPRPDVLLESLARLPARFKTPGTVTAGNASGINDGAAMLVLASEAAARDQRPLGRIVSSAVVGVDPHVMGIGPAPASRLALKRANL